MKVYVILLYSLGVCLTRTAGHDFPSSVGQKRNARHALKDIRYVSINQVRSRQKVNQMRNDRPEALAAADESVDDRTKTDFDILRVNPVEIKPDHSPEIQQQNHQINKTDQNYIKKMANQLNFVQRHADILSDYQRYILSQDPLVKKYIFDGKEPTAESETLSHRQNNRRALKLESRSDAFARAIDATPYQPFGNKKIILQPLDHLAQSSEIRYVSLAAPNPINYPEPQTVSTDLKLLHHPRPYYYHGVQSATPKPSKIVPHFDYGSLKTSTHPTQSANPYNNHHNYDGHAYEFLYNVKDHEKSNHFGHMESKSDDKTYGFYFVHLPDGRLETVKYWADKTGYHAKVEFQGQATHPSFATKYKH